MHRAERLSMRRLVLLAVLALLHLSLWFWVDGRLHANAPTPEVHRRSEVRLLALRLPPLRPAVTAPAQRVGTPSRPRLPAQSQATQAITASPVLPTATEEPAIETTAPSPVQASASGPAPALLTSEATRRALREAARSPLLSERAASAMGDGPPIGPEQKLGRQIQQAAVGDCLKGEFAGSGAGLLSLPFWLLAEARGKCRR